MSANVRIFDNGGETADRYSVLIRMHHESSLYDSYDMSENADQPNGVCMYSGVSFVAEAQTGFNEIMLGEAPTGVLVQIINILAAHYD